MADAVSEFAPRRLPHVQDLSGLETEIAQHRQAVERSTATFAEVPARDALTDIAIMLASLPLRMAMEMAEAVVTLPEFKAPENKIQLAMLLNEWAEKRLAAQYADR